MPLDLKTRTCFACPQRDDYDLDGNVQTKSKTGGSTSPSGPINESVSYVYDKTGQLTQAQGVRNGVNFTEIYSFDRNGNRTMTGYQTGTNNRLMNDGTYSYDYDLDGNMQTKSKTGEYTTYVWDYRNRLTDILVRATPTGPVTKSAHYVYDADDRRIGVSEDADGEGPGAAVQKWTVYDGANPYADFTGSSLQKRYLYGPAMDEIYGRMGTNELPEWYLTDHLGSIRQIVNSAGGVLDAINYKSFGQIDSETAPAGGDRFKFTAREWDDMWAQYYYHARYYGPDVGRFRSEDPIGFDGRDVNLYRYVHNQPTSQTDPFGKVGVFIEGTGQNAQDNTIIRQLHDMYTGNKDYFEVATVYAFFLGTSASSDLDRIKEFVRTRPNEPVDIFGWSRGAVLALQLAQFLRGQGRTVRFLGLVDPVSTNMPTYSRNITTNTQNAVIVYATRTGRNFEFANSLWDAIGAGCQLLVFGHDTGYEVNDPRRTTLTVEEFYLTHPESGWSQDILNYLVQQARRRGVPI